MASKILILKDSTKNQIKQTNVQSFQSIASIVSSALGPKAMQKLILTQIGALQMTNDGNAILRELDVAHPAAKTLIEISKTQDDEVGDGTTSIIILASAIFSSLNEIKDIHPVIISKNLFKALDFCNLKMKEIAFNIQNNENSLEIIRNSIGTKLCKILDIDIGKLAYEACEIAYGDIKNMCKVEKILDTDFKSSTVIKGISLMKNIYHPQMRKEIKNPKILNLKCHFDYLKGASQTSYEFKKDSDFQRAQEIEIEQVVEKVIQVLKWKPDIICTQSAVNDAAMTLFAQHNITVIRQLRTTEAARIHKATGARIVTNPENITKEDFGTCELFKYEKFGQESYCRFDGCEKPEACTVYLKGPSNDILNELIRNFEDAIKVAQNLKRCPMLSPGGGAFEIFISNELMKKSEDNNIDSFYKKILIKLSNALSIIPETLAKNSGVDDVLSVVNKLKVENKKDKFMGINGNTGEIQNMKNVIMESFSVKEQCLRSAIEVVIMIIRVDGIIKSKVKEN